MTRTFIFSAATRLASRLRKTVGTRSARAGFSPALPRPEFAFFRSLLTAGLVPIPQQGRKTQIAVETERVRPE